MARDIELSAIGTFASFRAHRRFCCEGEPAEFVYRMMTGVAQGYRVSADGHRQILQFYTPGNLFGLEADPHYTIFVDSVTEGRVQIMKRTAIDKIISTNCSASSELVSCLSHAMRRSQEHIALLGKPAEEKLAAFLQDMCNRLSDCEEFDLPMMRQEIADHLGITIETVSRILTHFRQIGAINLSGSRHVVLNRKKLSHLGYSGWKQCSDKIGLPSCKASPPPNKSDDRLDAMPVANHAN